MHRIRHVAPIHHDNRTSLSVFAAYVAPVTTVVPRSSAWCPLGSLGPVEGLSVPERAADRRFPAHHIGLREGSLGDRTDDINVATRFASDQHRTTMTCAHSARN